MKHIKLPKQHTLGCLIGGAVGDALGAPIEFTSIQTIRQQYGPDGVTGYVEFRDGHGEFTDDTQMTLFSAEAMLIAICRAHMKGIGRALPTLARNAYLRWRYTQEESGATESVHRDGGWLHTLPELYSRRAPGITCLTAIVREGRDLYAKNDRKGCGGVMRTAPAGLVLDSMATAFQHGIILARVTHGHPTGYLSAGFFSALIWGINSGMSLIDAIRHALNLLTAENACAELVSIIRTAAHMAETTRPTPEHIAKLGEGWVAEEALAIAIYCSLTFQDDFAGGVLAAVNHSGDSDSTGSLTGNILGLLLGIDAIPREWRENLHGIGIVTQIAEDLYAEIEPEGFMYCTESWLTKYRP